MSKEIIRQLVETRFRDFKGLDNTRKSYPNLKDPVTPATGQWARIRTEFVKRDVTSISDHPCTRRVGTIVIDVFEKLDVGTANISKLTDALEDWFDFYVKDGLYCYASETVDNGKIDSYYLSTVYIPFEYDEN